MTEFASRLNSPAEQRAILNEIIETFDATQVKTGMERAREIAAQAREVDDATKPVAVTSGGMSPARRNEGMASRDADLSPVQPGLWEAA